MHFFIEFLKVLSIKVTCFYFGKPEVNRTDLSYRYYVHSVRSKTSIELTYKYHLSHLISSTK